MSDYSTLQARLGYHFRKAALLRQALTHPSVTHDQGAPLADNQRLEFLGDAVLQLALTAALYEGFPACEEGPLTKARAKLVNRRALAVHGQGLGLGENLTLSRGEELHGGRERQSALADAFEALVGAIYLDGGFEAARAFIRREFAPAFSGLEVIPVLDNPKGELQEYLQASFRETPQYHVVSISGPDHDRQFECIVRHAGQELARGVGKSKKIAEGEAARAALTKLRSVEPPANPTSTPEEPGAPTDAVAP